MKTKNRDFVILLISLINLPVFFWNNFQGQMTSKPEVYNEIVSGCILAWCFFYFLVQVPKLLKP